MKKILETILSLLARHTLKMYQPVVVAVTGNVGKTSAKEAIEAALRYSDGKVRASKGNLNNELGVPLTVLGDWAGEYYDKGPSVLFWLKVLFSGILKICIPHNYPDALVLEYGADRPGDIAKLTKHYPPDVAVITGIGEMPVHVEFFAGPQEVADEKAKLIEALQPDRSAILNFDDLTVLNLKDRTKAEVRTFGFGDGASVRVQNFRYFTSDAGWSSAFMLLSGDKSWPLEIKNTLSRPQALACAAGLAVAIALEVESEKAVQGLTEYQPQPGRMRVLKGIKNSIVIDDTYNASPMAVHSALDTLSELPPGRKVAVLGDMLELGKYTFEAHQAVGTKAGEIVDVLICVGEKARVIADAAANQKPAGNIFVFHTSEEAKTKVQELIEEGDIVLVKGSQGKRMERIVKEIMAEPDKAGQLLVRQSQKWLNRP